MSLTFEPALAVAETTAWVTVLVAVLTGLFGFLSGASAAAVITTSHERREQFRNRLIEAADAYVEGVTKVFRAIEEGQRVAEKPVSDAATRLQYFAGRIGGLRSDPEAADRTAHADFAEWAAEAKKLDGALRKGQAVLDDKPTRALSDLDGLRAHLVVVFPNDVLARAADDVHDSLLAWSRIALGQVTDFGHRLSSLAEHLDSIAADVESGEARGRNFHRFYDIVVEQQAALEDRHQRSYSAFREIRDRANNQRDRLLAECNAHIRSRRPERPRRRSLFRAGGQRRGSGSAPTS